MAALISSRLRFWLRAACLVGLVVVGLIYYNQNLKPIPSSPVLNDSEPLLTVRDTPFTHPSDEPAQVVVHGGAGGVSGSLSTLSFRGNRWMIDCGSYYPDGGGTLLQREQIANEKSMILPRGALSTDGVFLTHAHLDHIGRIPLLVRNGYQLPIYLTEPTSHITKTMLEMSLRYEALRQRNWRWSTNSMKEDYFICHWSSSCKWASLIKHPRGFRGTLKALEQQVGLDASPCKVCARMEFAEIQKLYDVQRYNSKKSLGNGVSFTFLDAGHIPGSASFLFNIETSKGGVSCLFSGDVGNRISRLVRGPDPIPKVDHVFMECTYGGYRRNPEVEREYARFRGRVTEVIRAGGIAWIPAFALDRTQKVLREISKAQDDYPNIYNEIPIVCSSSSGRTLTELYRNHGKSEWFRKEFNQENDPLKPAGYFVPKYPDNLTNKLKVSPLVLITTSGMMDEAASKGLKGLLGQSNVTVFLVGYQDPQSPGGQLKAGKKTIVYKDGDKVGNVKARVESFSCFSAHGDATDMDRWLSQNDSSTTIYLVHGDKDSLEERRAQLVARGFPKTFIAQKGEPIVLAPPQ
ncbi:MAG: MBL fold metallo-hydrolase [Opitutae bacterium]|jgi:metallo-beta-lactamase family protein|nr:MBL fold metallo-hydrolase [Opitutae bacterium]